MSRYKLQYAKQARLQLAEIAKWWLSRGELTEYHEAVAYLHLFEAQYQRDKEAPLRHLKGKKNIGLLIAAKLEQNKQLLEEL